MGGVLRPLSEVGTVPVYWSPLTAAVKAGAKRSPKGCLYREDEHAIIELEKMAGCLFLSIFSSKESGFGVSAPRSHPSASG